MPKDINMDLMIKMLKQKDKEILQLIDICEDAITEIKARDSEIIDIESNHAMYFGDDHPIHGNRMQRSRYAQKTKDGMEAVVTWLKKAYIGTWDKELRITVLEDIENETD